MTQLSETPVRILIINPNTSQHMTDALKPVVEELGYQNVQFSYFTSPTTPDSIPSINSPADAAASARACLPALLPLLAQHDAFLIACYSQHPLVPQLQHECTLLSQAATHGADGRGARKYVTGIFEASVVASLSLVSSHDAAFGIVSTGKVWEEALRAAVDEMLGLAASHPTGARDGGSVGGSSRFVGCRTTGLNASELHELPPERVRGKMMEATAMLLRDGKAVHTKVKAVCLGCAGMVGLEEAVREACVLELGADEGKSVAIVDGVKAGVGTLISLARGGF